MSGFDEKWLRDYQKRTGLKVTVYGAEKDETEKKSKYGNRKTEEDGMLFDSKHESKVYQELRMRAKSGEFCGLARQVAFLLPGGVKYVADFVTLKTDGSFQVWDAKSSATAKNAVYRLKKKQMKECLGIEIQEI